MLAQGDHVSSFGQPQGWHGIVHGDVGDGLSVTAYEREENECKTMTVEQWSTLTGSDNIYRAEYSQIVETSEAVCSATDFKKRCAVRVEIGRPCASRGGRVLILLSFARPTLSINSG